MTKSGRRGADDAHTYQSLGSAADARQSIGDTEDGAGGFHPDETENQGLLGNEDDQGGEDDEDEENVDQSRRLPPPNIRSTNNARDHSETRTIIHDINRFIWLLTLSAGLSGLLFGYDTGIISSTLVSLGSSLSSNNTPPTILQKSLITSSTSLLALLSSLPSGMMADAFGRKPVILVADSLFILGAAWQAFTGDVWGLIGGRAIVGLAIGSASFVAPLYIAELAPAAWRGRLVTVSALFITAGQVVAYIVGWLFSTMRPNGWRWMVGLGIVPAVLQVLLLLKLPDTPRWLVKDGQTDEARVVLRKILNGSNTETGTQPDSEVESIMAGIRRDLEEEGINDLTSGKPGFFSLLSTTRATLQSLLRVPAHRRALIISCMLQASQQLCGFNTLMYFSATIFSLCGFQSPTLAALSIATTNFIFTLVAFQFIDRIGRRRILLYSIPFMVLGLLICATAFNFVKLPLNLEDPNRENNDINGLVLDNNEEKAQQQQSTPWSATLLASLLLYTATYALGLGNIPWHQSELFPLPIRSTGSSISTSTNWTSNFVVGLTFLPLLEVAGGSWTFGGYAVICLGIWVAVYKLYPETSGLGLEDVSALLGGEGFGVQESLRLVGEGRRTRVRGG